jgi:ribose transport system substrate-binding protein
MLVCISALAAGEKPEKAGKKVVYYLSPNQFDEFQTTASKLLKEAITAKGYEFRELVAGNEDVTLQLNQIEDAITQDADAIIVAAVDRTAIVNGVEKARESGIPVIAFDRKILDTKIDFTSAGGNEKIGILAGEESARQLKAKYGEVKGSILHITGDPADSYSILVGEAFNEVLGKYSNVQITTKIAEGWEASNAADIADDWLVAHPETDLIFSHAEHLAAAIVSVLESKGFERGEIIMISTVGMPMGLDLIRDGWLQATIDFPTVQCVDGVVMFLDDIISKKEIKPGKYTVAGAESELTIQPYGPEILHPGQPITKENINDPELWGNQVE